MKKLLGTILFFNVHAIVASEPTHVQPWQLSEKIDGIFHLLPSHPFYNKQQTVFKHYCGDKLRQFFDDKKFYLADPKGKCDILCKRRQTPYHLWAQLGRTDLLLKEYDEGHIIPHLDVQDGTGYTPLALAAWHGKPQTCRELVERGADPNSRNFYAGSSILHEVIHNTKHAPMRRKRSESYELKLRERRMTDAQALEVIKALDTKGTLRVDIKDMYDHTPLEWLESKEMSFSGSPNDVERQELLTYLRDIRADQHAKCQEARRLSPRFDQWVPRLSEKSIPFGKIISAIPEVDANGRYYERVLSKEMQMDEVFAFLDIA